MGLQDGSKSMKTRINSPVSINTDFLRLLHYIVKYRKLRGRASARVVVEQLILAYAKQLTSGMPEANWRANIIELINMCEQTHAERFNNEKRSHQKLKRTAEKLQRPR